MDGLIHAIFDRSKVAMLALLVLSMIGVSTFLSAPREADPDIPLPFAQVIIPLPGISPQDAERLLIRPTETELRTLEGLVQMDATAFDGAAQIQLEFEVGLDMNQVLIDVREAVDRARAEYPTSAHEPIIREMNAQSLFPVLTVVLSGEAPERALFDASVALEDRLRAVPGVLDVSVIGARDEVIEIEISPAAMENYDLNPFQVGNAIRSNNTLVTAGNMRFRDGGYAVKVPGLFKSLADIESIPVKTDADTVVTLGDVAKVRRTFEEPTGHARFNGRMAIGMDITKRSDTNLIELTDAIKAEALAMAEDWPSTITLSFIGDMSTLVDAIFTSLTASILLAIILVMIVVVAALGLRSALLVGIAIPASFMIGFALIGFMGFTLNNLVMFSMVLAVGMLVDGAIVVVEYADRRMAEGSSRRDAFIEASTRMFWPITASTATTLAAFLPFLFWESINGYFMRWIPITLILVLSSSLVVALIFLPIIGANFGLPGWTKRKFKLKGQTHGREKIDLDNVDPTTLTGFTGRYSRMIANLIRRPILVIIGAFGVVFGAQTIFANSNTPVEQFINADFEQIIVFVAGRGNISDQEALQISSDIQNVMIENPAIEYAYLQTGPQVSRGRNAPADGIAQITLDLIPYKQRDHSLIVVEQLRAQTANYPGVKIEIRQPEQGPQVGKDVQVELSALNYETTAAAGDIVLDFLQTHTTDVNGSTVPTYIDLEDNQPLPGVEWQIIPDRAEAGRYGVSVADIGATVQLVTEGLIVDTFRPDDSEEELDIRLRYPRDSRTLSQLSSIKVASPMGPVPVDNFTTREPVQQTDRVVRRDGRRVLDIQANANTTVEGHVVSQDQATKAMLEFLESGVLEEQFGSSFDWRLRGAAEETEESSAFMMVAMMAAMVMIGVILLLQFNSYYHAFLTLTAVVLSVFGVFLGIALTGQYISAIMTGVGIVALAGIVVNNNIVLIDTYHNLRHQGLDPMEAATRTAAQRMRPVLLTTVTTIIGLLPMVFEIDIDFANATLGIGNETSDWWVLLSSAIVYGLAFATLLTLILTPVMLAAPYVLRQRIDPIIVSLFGDKTAPPADKTSDDDTSSAYGVAAE